MSYRCIALSGSGLIFTSTASPLLINCEAFASLSL